MKRIAAFFRQSLAGRWQQLRGAWTAPKNSLLLAWLALPLSVLLAADANPDAADQRYFSGWDSDESGVLRFSLDDLPGTASLPGLQPAQFLEVPRDRAQRINAAIPFSLKPNPSARPFRLGGDAQSHARAVDCLAAAQYYEAGGDLEGQRAVAQVVLNRARHPAYPSSVCGVVFQGAERRTGCQFTFTCDGAMARLPMASLWQQTLSIARAALAGAVYAKVGLATHYHTDWVVPVWSGELDKITNVRSHLFFRWPGTWGQPLIFSTAPSATEPLVTRLALISPNHSADSVSDEVAILPLADLDLSEAEELSRGSRDLPLPSLAGVNLRGSQLRLAHPAGDAFGFLLPNELPGAFGLLALDVCEGREFCKVMGWTDPASIPRGFPIPFDAQQTMSFLYIYDRASRREILAWDCARFPRTDPQECLDDQATQWDAVSRPGG